MNHREHLRRVLHEKARLKACLAALAAYAGEVKNNSIAVLVSEATDAFLFYEIASGFARDAARDEGVRS